MSTGWEFFLARSSDMAILARITDATDKSLNPVFNQKGSFSCTVKIDSAAALLVEKWKHCIVVQRPDGTAAWSGPITAIVDSAVAGTTQLSAQGWSSELDYRWIRTVTELQQAVLYATPSPAADNPGFETNTTGWTAGSSTITRDTGTSQAGSASGRWDNTGATDNLGAGDTLTGAITGKFFAGVTYVITFYIKANSTSASDVAAQFGDLVSGDVSTAALSITSSFVAKTITWIPTTSYSAASLKLTAVNGGWRYWIDSVSIADSAHAAVPTMTNGGFETNSSGWTTTGTSGGSTKTRDTSVSYSGSASLRWDNTGASDNLANLDGIVATLSSGTFYANVSYKLTFMVKPSAADSPILLTFGTGGDYGLGLCYPRTTDWKQAYVWWTPTTNVDYSTVALTLAAYGGAYYWIDKVEITQQGGFAQDTTFDNIDDGKIAEALVRLANQQTDSTGATRATHLAPIATSMTKRTRTYQVGQNIGAAIRELSEIENGFDIDVDPTSREIAFISNTSFTDQTDVAYGYNTFPRNLDDVIVNDDGTTKANSINVQGAFTIGNTDSPTDIADTGVLLEDWISAADIKDELIVGAYANEEIVFRADGQMTIAAKPSPGAPMPYIDYEWGDKVYISANKGRMQLDRQAARVFSGRISWNSQNEAVLDELGLAP